MAEHFELIGSPEYADTAILAHVPHSSTAMPGMLRWTVNLDDDELAKELLRVTDHFTDDIFDSLTYVGGVMFVNRLTRLVIDPERFRNDEDEVMSKQGAGAVYVSSSTGGRLRDDDFDREKLLVSYFDPYAEAMSRATSVILERFDQCLIVDCHSFPSVPLSWELDQNRNRPEICIGTDEFHTPYALVDTLMNHMESNGVEAEVDRPFKGTYVPLDYYNKDPRVQSLMIEVRRDLYMDELTGQPTRAFPAVKDFITALLEFAGVWALSTVK